MREESEHQRYMREALSLAVRGRGRTSPNPMVGAVVVKDGEVVGRGFHPRVGDPHAEVFALREAGERARGATLYVTLEPCSHYGRTPPCAPAVVEAGLAGVYAAMEDPNPQVAGRGLRLLREHGVETHIGLLEDEARRLNEAYLKCTATGLPFVEIKVAMTLDGKTATASGKSRWITGEAAREWVHRRRASAGAVMVGAETVRVDDPALTVRLPDDDAPQPLRVVVSASGSLDLGAQVFLGPPPGAVVFHAEARGKRQEARGDALTLALSQKESESNQREGESNQREIEQTLALGTRHFVSEQGPVEFVWLPATDGGVDLREMLRWLAKRGVNDLLVEGGSMLNAALLRAGLVDRVSLFVAPKLFGGLAAPGAFGELGVDEPGQALALEDLEVSQVGADWLFQGRPSMRHEGKNGT